MKSFSLLMKKAARLGDTSLLSQLSRPGTHELHIKETFQGRCRFEGDSPVFPERLVILAFTNRSGSNLMAEYMRQANHVGGLGEVLNHDVVATRAAERGIQSMPDYFEDLHSQFAPGPKALGIKASWDQLAMLLRWNILDMFPKVIVVHMLRHDIVAQAVSYGIALQTKAWTSKQKPLDIEPDLDPQEVMHSVAQFHRANLNIRLLTKAYGMERFDIGYETIMNAPEINVTRVLHAARLAGPNWTPRTPGLAKQANDRNDAFTEALYARLRTAVEGS